VETVKALETRCFHCGKPGKGLERAIMVNGVFTHKYCADEAFRKTIVGLSSILVSNASSH